MRKKQIMGAFCSTKAYELLESATNGMENFQKINNFFNTCHLLGLLKDLISTILKPPSVKLFIIIMSRIILSFFPLQRNK